VIAEAIPARELEQDLISTITMTQGIQFKEFKAVIQD